MADLDHLTKGMHENAMAVAVMREKIDTLVHTVEGLSGLIWSDNGECSILVRMVRLENSVDNLKRGGEQIYKALENVNSAIDERSVQKWKVLAVASPGIMALLLSFFRIAFPSLGL